MISSYPIDTDCQQALSRFDYGPYIAVHLTTSISRFLFVAEHLLLFTLSHRHHAAHQQEAQHHSGLQDASEELLNTQAVLQQDSWVALDPTPPYG